MENNIANSNQETVTEETSDPQLPTADEGTTEVAQRLASELEPPEIQCQVSEETQQPISVVSTSEASQRSEEAQNNATSNNNVEPSSTARSMPDLLAGGDNAHRVMECLREIIQCPVCFTVPYGMRIFCCRNGHTCCRQCLIHFRNITRTLLRRPFCPVCRTSMVRRKVFRNVVAEQIVAEYTAILNENGETP